MAVGPFYAFSARNAYQFIACEDIGIFGAKSLLDPESSRVKARRLISVPASTLSTMSGKPTSLHRVRLLGSQVCSLRKPSTYCRMILR